MYQHHCLQRQGKVQRCHWHLRLRIHQIDRQDRPFLRILNKVSNIPYHFILAGF